MAVALALVGAVAPLASAGTTGASCTASGVVFGTATDAAGFTWSLGSTLLQNGTARVQVQAGSGGAFTTLSSATVRSSGARTTSASIATPSYLTAGTWNWRVQVTEWDGTVFTCSGPAFAVTRLPAPTVSMGGWGVTADGWRLPGSGQTALVTPGTGDASSGSTSLVRFQYAGGSWSSYQSAPAALPASDIVAIQAFRRTANAMSGATSTVTIRKDTSAPTKPVPAGASVEVGPDGAWVGFGASSDSQSGVSYYESRLISDDGSRGSWQFIGGQSTWVDAGAAGGTLLLRACDRVGNCSQTSSVALVPMRQPAPDRGDDSPVGADPDGGADGGAPARRASGSNRSSAVPRITALVAAAPRGGAGRVTVDLSRPAEVTFSFRGSPIARAWLGSGRTVVRLPAQPSARRGALTARPVAGAVAGDPISTTVSLPGGGRKGEAAVSTTRMRSGAQAVLYDMDAAVREVVDPQDGGLGLSAARGAMRQEPSTSGLFAPDDDSALVGKVTEEDLRGLDAGDIADVLREAIDNAPGHIVAFDELTPYEADPRSPFVKGGRIPAPDPSSPGAQLAEALISLDIPSPYGGTWASRVHVYIAPAVTSAMAAGRGPDRNLGRDGKARFRTYRTVMKGLARAGAVWIEAYHGLGARITPLTAVEWRTAPAAFLAEYRLAGGDASRLHFLITGTDAYPAGRLPSGCTTPQRCQWVLAEGTAAGRAILSNGVGAYRLGAHARPWLAEWQVRVA